MWGEVGVWGVTDVWGGVGVWGETDVWGEVGVWGEVEYVEQNFRHRGTAKALLYVLLYNETSSVYHVFNFSRDWQLFFGCMYNETPQFNKVTKELKLLFWNPVMYSFKLFYFCEKRDFGISYSMNFFILELENILGLYFFLQTKPLVWKIKNKNRPLVWILTPTTTRWQNNI